MDIRINASYEDVPGLILQPSSDIKKVRSILWDSIQKSLEKCFDNQNPFTAKGWIVDLWKFRINRTSKEFNMTWIQTSDIRLEPNRDLEEIKFLKIARPIENFWSKIMLLAKHKNRYGYSRYRKRPKKTAYFARY